MRRRRWRPPLPPALTPEENPTPGWSVFLAAFPISDCQTGEHAHLHRARSRLDPQQSDADDVRASPAEGRPVRPGARRVGELLMTTRNTPLSMPVRLLREWRSQALWLACAHLAVDSVMALLGLLALTAFAVTLILVPLGVGIPLVMAAARILDRLAAVERARFAATCGWDIPSPTSPDPHDPMSRSIRRLVADRSLWRTIGYFVLRVPVSAITLAGLVIAWSIPLALLPLPVYWVARPPGRIALGPLVVNSLGGVIVVVVALLLAVLLVPTVMRLLMMLDAALASALLAPSPSAELAQRVEHLTRTRAATVEAAEAERRRIERDLHDGAQQRLIALSLTLGRASARLKSAGDTDTRALVEDAKHAAGEAITEIRDLTRGLHPPVLTDRGLDAALSAVAAQCPIPVEVDVQVTPRPSLTVESIAYFVVTEALTNVAKHARADRAWVRIVRTGDRLTVTVTDNGVGGADPARGSGLRGLTDRVSGVDGRIHITSPAGGPTVVEAVIACG
ncbi:sensor histidine kinase [Nocardia terpenica]|uniref:histidine kinase n=2 Tax=Nocardia terpenica TaxID=455432 RepID=A0A6G9Z8X2_9NOCA|nr:sensor histidine kinase [Nocardia terpenica]